MHLIAHFPTEQAPQVPLLVSEPDSGLTWNSITEIEPGLHSVLRHALLRPRHRRTARDWSVIRRELLSLVGGGAARPELRNSAAREAVYARLRGALESLPGYVGEAVSP